MKRAITYNCFAGILALAMLLSGCTKQLEVDPQESIDASIALTTKEGVEASITAIYARLKSPRLYGRDFIAYPDALADNGHATNASGRFLSESNNVLNAHFTTTVWTNSYASINEINLALEAIAKGVATATPTDVAKWEGQLFFLRGLYYFDLMRIYAYIPGAVEATQDRGGVPLTLTGIATAEAALAFKPSRAELDEVYRQIVKDLEAAESRLTSNTATTAASVGVATKQAAQALLARVNLYRKNFADAKKWADEVIASRGFTINTAANYVSQWRAENNNENIFAIRFVNNSENIGVNESLQTSFTTIITLPGTSSATGGFGDLVPTLSLLNDLGITLQGGNSNLIFLALRGQVANRSTDVRNQLFESGTNGRTKGYVECTKYLGKNGFLNLDNIPVLRIAEMYLIRAEAQATTGSPVYNEAAARADLKYLKVRRYSDYTGSANEAADNALSGQALFEEIFKQRRLEFAFEGHRFFDFKRLHRNVLKGAPNTNPTLAFTDMRLLPALPQTEVDGNPNLKQNFGY